MCRTETEVLTPSEESRFLTADRWLLLWGQSQKLKACREKIFFLRSDSVTLGTTNKNLIKINYRKHKTQICGSAFSNSQSIYEFPPFCEILCGNGEESFSWLYSDNKACQSFLPCGIHLTWLTNTHG